MRAAPLLAILVLMNFWLPAQNIEAGFHVGWARVGSIDPSSPENTGEFGMWALFWPGDHLAVSADWVYLPLDDFQLVIPAGSQTAMVGETDRNRQLLDFTLQFHLNTGTERQIRLFAELGGGALWDNREVVNPAGRPGFEEQGPETTLRGQWTVGGGIRTRILPHLHWIGQVKLHNLGRDERDTLRIFTGLVISLR